MHPVVAPHHLRASAEAAFIAWLVVILNDWHEGLQSGAKGSAYATLFIGSLPCLAVGVMLAMTVRRRLVDDVRSRRARDGAMPSPRWILLSAVRRGVPYALCNVLGYLAMMGSHPLRVLSSFVLAGVVGGLWLGRSVIVREHPVEVSRPYALAIAILPASFLATLAASAALVTTRMHLDDAIGWAFDPVPFCGGVEIGNASMVLLPVVALAMTALGGVVLVGRRLADERRTRLAHLALGAGVAVLGLVAFAELTEHLLAAAPPRSCRNTPYVSPLEALQYLRSLSFMRSVLWWSGGLGGVIGAALLLVASRRVPEAPQPAPPSLGPHRTSAR